MVSPKIQGDFSFKNLESLGEKALFIIWEAYPYEGKESGTGGNLVA